MGIWLRRVDKTQYRFLVTFTDQNDQSGDQMRMNFEYFQI